MKVVDAVWEKRNLGITCSEITPEQQDDYPLLQKELHKIESDYIVVKIPTSKIELALKIQDDGFRFIETMTVCRHSGKDFRFNPLQRRIIDQCSYQPMDDHGIEKVYEETERGLFTSDRISLDPFFQPEISNRRYVNWIKDELDAGSRLYTLKYKTADVGFFALQPVKGKYVFAFLSGVYPDYQKSGFGAATYYFEVNEGIRLGAKVVKTAFSSNNRGALGIHLDAGCILEDQFYVFIKHRNKGF